MKRLLIAFAGGFVVAVVVMLYLTSRRIDQSVRLPVAPPPEPRAEGS